MGKSVGQKQLCDGNARGTGAVYYHAAIFLLFAGQPEGVDDAGQDHNGGAVLIIVEHRNVQPLF